MNIDFQENEDMPYCMESFDYNTINASVVYHHHHHQFSQSNLSMCI